MDPSLFDVFDLGKSNSQNVTEERPSSSSSSGVQFSAPALVEQVSTSSSLGKRNLESISRKEDPEAHEDGQNEEESNKVSALSFVFLLS
jgi:hypothetical protein